MAKPAKVTNKDGSISYRIFISNTLTGKRESKTLSTRRLAQDWADKRLKQIEHSLVHGESSDFLISDMLKQYQDMFSHKYGRSKRHDIDRLRECDIASIMISKLSAKDIINHCIERNKVAKPQTVKNDIVWLRTVLRSMSATAGYDYPAKAFDDASIVLKNEGLTHSSEKRDRLPTNAELWQLSRHLATKKPPYLHIMWFAIFSARRLSEITNLRWDDINHESRTIFVRDIKSPNKKALSLWSKLPRPAYKIIMRQPKTSELIFPYGAKTVSASFTRACKLIGIKDLHFHDMRHEACTRLFKYGLSIQQVQKISLHQSWSTLAIYTNLDAGDIDI